MDIPGFLVGILHQKYVQFVNVLIGEMEMKIISKQGVFDSDPTLHITKLESGALLIYTQEPDQTIYNVWRRSVL